MVPIVCMIKCQFLLKNSLPFCPSQYIDEIHGEYLILFSKVCQHFTHYEFV